METPREPPAYVAHSGEAERLAEALTRAGSPERAEREKRYLKSELEHLGVPVGEVRRLVKGLVRDLKEGASLEGAALAGLTDALWEREVHEVRLAAVLLLVEAEGLLTREDLPLIERLLKEARTWALVDPLAIYALGPLRGRQPQGLADVLDAWVRHDDLWLRRSALLAYLLDVRRGDERAFVEFGERADALLEDGEFFVRKALGWVLREGTKRRPEAVFDWLLPRASRASALTLREASKHLPAEQREALRQARGRSPE